MVVQVSQLPVAGHPHIGRKYKNRGKSIFTSNQPLVTGHQTLYQSTVSDTHAMGMEFTTNRANLGSEQSFRHEVQNPANNSKRVLLPLETDFSNMSDPSIIIEPPGNNWRSDLEFHRLPSLDVFPGGIILEVNISP